MALSLIAASESQSSAAIAASLMQTAFRQTPKRKPDAELLTELQIEKSISGHEARNAKLRSVFIEKQVDPREPRSIECHFYAPTEDDATNLANTLTLLGFKILVQNPSTTVWNIEAEIEQSIELTIRREFTEELVRTAAAHSAQYDGWGTRI